MRRPLTTVEAQVIRWFADHATDAERRQLLNDLENTTAETIVPDGSRVRFHINGYTRPATVIEHPLPVYAVVLDADAAVVSVAVVRDENDRLLELELIRYEPGEVVEPDWSTLRKLAPEEVIDLGHTDVSIKVFPQKE